MAERGEGKAQPAKLEDELGKLSIADAAPKPQEAISEQSEPRLSGDGPSDAPSTSAEGESGQGRRARPVKSHDAVKLFVGQVQWLIQLA